MLILPIRESIAATPTTRILRLDLDGHPFEFSAGQAVLVGLHGQAERRPYSIACAPEHARQRRQLELLVRTAGTGGAGRHLPLLASGTRVDVQGPLGTFVFPHAPAERRFLFIAGGTGIAPLRAMLWHALLTGVPGHCTVAYSARTPAELAWADELQDLAREDRIRLHLTVTRGADSSWAGARGRLDARHLAPLVPDAGTLCFICGPAALVQEIPMALVGLGVPPSKIHLELW